MKKICIAILILVAISIRLYHITKFTEFLGDQGRDALILRELVTEGKWPVVGPTVGAGHYTGPFYYYLISPAFVLFGSNPVIAAIEIVVISVTAIVLFLSLATSLFSFPIAYGVSLLWSLSPLMIIQDRRLWNPTPIPFFVLLLITSLFLIFKQKKYWAFLPAAFASAALIQLHYVNGISLLLAGILVIGITYKLIQQGQGKKIIVWLIGSVGLFVLMLYPFISYEAKRGFTDITGSAMTLALKDGQIFSKRLYLNTFMDISSVLASYVVVLPWKLWLIVISAGLIIGNLVQRRTVSYLLVIWFLVGIACLSFYKDTIQPQYAYQFIPIVFLLFAGCLQSMRRLRWPLIIGLILLMTGSSWFFRNPYKATDFDIPRINALTDTVVSLTNGTPFAFTVMNSRSFTDFHVRYFFSMKKAEIVSVDDINNKTLFIVCEAGCPKAESMSKISVMCYTDLCPLDKPEIHLKDWVYVSTTEVGSSAIYSYER